MIINKNTLTVLLILVTMKLCAQSETFVSEGKSGTEEWATKAAMSDPERAACNNKKELKIISKEIKKTQGGNYICRVTYELVDKEEKESNGVQEGESNQDTNTKEMVCWENPDPIDKTESQISAKYGKLKKSFGNCLSASKKGYDIMVWIVDNNTRKITITDSKNPTGISYDDAMALIKKYYPNSDIQTLGKIEDARTGAVLLRTVGAPLRFIQYHSEESLQPLSNHYGSVPPKYYLDVMDENEGRKVMSVYKIIQKGNYLTLQIH
jgi:hypothetical protein